jgi:prevent-host-death family protein
MAEPTQSKRQVNIHEAKTNLSKLIQRVEAGEEIVIARNGTPVARLVPIEKRFPVAPAGFLKGEIEILPGFYEADEEIARDFEDAINKPFPDFEPDEGAAGADD